MTDYEELLTAAASGLPGADGLARAFGTAASVFEAIRFAAESYADTDPELFAAWLLTAAEAADGRDALLHAASAPPSGLASAPQLVAGQLDGIARALTGLLAAAGGHADDPGDAAACERAAACAGRIRDLLAEDTT